MAIIVNKRLDPMWGTKKEAGLGGPASFWFSACLERSRKLEAEGECGLFGSDPTSGASREVGIAEILNDTPRNEHAEVGLKPEATAEGISNVGVKLEAHVLLVEVDPVGRQNRLRGPHADRVGHAKARNGGATRQPPPRDTVLRRLGLEGVRLGVPHDIEPHVRVPALVDLACDADGDLESARVAALPTPGVEGGAIASLQLSREDSS